MVLLRARVVCETYIRFVDVFSISFYINFPGAWPQKNT